MGAPKNAQFGSMLERGLEWEWRVGEEESVECGGERGERERGTPSETTCGHLEAASRDGTPATGVQLTRVACRS